MGRIGIIYATPCYTVRHTKPTHHQHAEEWAFAFALACSSAQSSAHRAPRATQRAGAHLEKGDPVPSFAPFRITFPPTLPAVERDTLLATLRTTADVQLVAHKDGMLETLSAIITQTGQIADALVNIATLANLLYAGVQQLRQRGMLPDITLFRPNQPELNLSRVQNAEEIAAWLRQVTR